MSGLITGGLTDLGPSTDFFMQRSTGSVIYAAVLFVVAAGPVLIGFYVLFLCILAAGLFVFDAVLVPNSAGTLPQCVLIV